MLGRALVVDPSKRWLEGLARVFGEAFDLTCCDDFRTARALVDTNPAFLITNIRLGEYNGLHLVHLAALSQGKTRCVVYSDEIDPFLFQEAQQLRAFCETRERLVHALPAYLAATLPTRDRRSVRKWDRRGEFRGGRRAADSFAAQIATT